MEFAPFVQLLITSVRKLFIHLIKQSIRRIRSYAIILLVGRIWGDSNRARFTEARARRGTFRDGMMSSSYPATVPTARGFDLYQGKHGCYGREFAKPSFDHAQLDGTLAQVFTRPEWDSFKSAVCDLCKRYVALSPTMVSAPALVLGIIVVLRGVVVKTDASDAFGVEFVGFFVLAAAMFMYRKRVVDSRKAVDQELIALLADWTQKMGGRATFELHVENDGVFTNRHQILHRALYIVPAGAAAPLPGTLLDSNPDATNSAPAFSPLSYAQNPPPTSHSDTHVNIYPAPAAASSAYSYPTAPDEQTRGPGAREVFIAVVPKGVTEGQTFAFTTPMGRNVMLVAPTGAREGLEFQTSG